MISKRIRCSRCKYEGSAEITGTATAESSTDLFTSEGHDPYSGQMYFRCPRCKVFIAVEPTDALESNTMTGYASQMKNEVARQTKSQWTMPVLGGLYTGLALFILVIQTFC